MNKNNKSKMNNIVLIIYCEIKQYNVCYAFKGNTKI